MRRHTLSPLALALLGLVTSGLTAVTTLAAPAVADPADPANPAALDGSGAMTALGAPTLALPTTDDAGVVHVSATTDAPYVRFSLTRETPSIYSTPGVLAPEPVPVESGTAATTIPAAGLPPGFVITAVACTGPDAAGCATVGDTAYATWDMGSGWVPGYPSPRMVDPTLEQLHVALAEDHHAGAILQFRLDAGATDHVFSRTSGDQDFDLSDVADGEYQVWPELCSQLDPTVCATNGYLNARTVLVRRVMSQVHVSDSSLTQNGDGFVDVVRAKLYDDRAFPDAEGTWRVIDSTGHVVIGSRPLNAERPHPGLRTFSVDPRAILGHPLPNGTYRLQVDMTATYRGKTYTSRGTGQIFNANVPSLTGAHADSSVIYPYTDSFHDYLGLDRSVGPKALAPVTTEVLNSSGAVVDSFGYPQWYEPTWGGRRESDAVWLPEGYYRLRILLTSWQGDEKTITTQPIRLSHKSLVRHEVDRTYPLSSTLLADRSGRCSDVRVPGFRGRAESVGYLSAVRCRGARTDGSRVALGIHGIRLPPAYQYGSIDLYMRGYDMARDYPVVPRLGLVRKDGTRSPTSYALWQSTPRQQFILERFNLGSFVDSKHRLRFYIRATGGTHYPGRSVRIRYWYAALEYPK